MNKEQLRLQNPLWRKWGPYLSERQWGTVREDYSEHGEAWDYFSHDHARSRVYRWGEDGIAGISDDMQRICFAVTLWNGRDPILKERLFGLTGNEGNHGEDVKELYYYLDNTPSHAYMKHLYKYPQSEYPYADLVNANRNRSKFEREYELLDTGIFNGSRYFDVFTEYAKNDIEDMCICITVHNRGNETAYIALLPTLWLRNLWSFGLMNEKPSIHLEATGVAEVRHELGNYHFYFEQPGRTLMTENETNTERLYNVPNKTQYVKDAFHTAVQQQRFDWLEEKKEGTKFAPMYEFNIEAQSYVTIKLRISRQLLLSDAFDKNFDVLFEKRISEADEFYQSITETKDKERFNIQRQAFAGMLWSKQYFNIDIPKWLNGDKGQITPSESRKSGRNHQWHSLNNEDIISMPDKWEYPWYAAWDLAFHCVPLSLIDPQFAKDQLILFLREWYMHPNGQLPAYEWAFGDVNPPVHAWAAWRVYQMDRDRNGTGDREFLERIFHKLMLNFTWWVNRKDADGRNIFQGGFLGLDNIGIFDRSAPLPTGGHINQSDGTAWMAMFCLNMLRIAVELSEDNHVYEDIATKFFEHFLYIAEAMTNIGGSGIGLWDEEDEFYYDVLNLPGGRRVPLRVRSMVGLIPLFAVEVLDGCVFSRLPEFARRLRWFLEYRPDLARLVSRWTDPNADERHLLSLLRGHRMKRLLARMLDETEFLSDHGIRAVSKYHESSPFAFEHEGNRFSIGYVPGESNSGVFGGNSNWRGPIWMPVNFLLIESLKRFHRYYGDEFTVECPTGSGDYLNLDQVATELSRRLTRLFLKDETGRRPVFGESQRHRDDPAFRDNLLFHEYFHGDTGRGVGASHQTGWTGLVALLLRDTSLEDPPAIDTAGLLSEPARIPVPAK